MEKIFVTGALPGDALERLSQWCELDVWSRAEPLPAAVLCERLQGCSGLLCLLTNRVNNSLLDANPQLRWVSSMSVGVDHVDVPGLTARGIPLGNTPGVLVETTADLTFALLLAAARRIPEADRYIRAGHWRADQAWSPTMLTGKDVAGTTLGIIGLGETGQAVARRAAGFGMRVLGWTRSDRQLPGVETLALDNVLGQSDFLSVNVALTADTKGLLDAAAIARIKPGAVLINTARGGIVDEIALAAALADGRLYAAGIDVFEREPVAMDNPLLALPNVVVAPHIGSASNDTRAQMAALAADNLIAAVKGERMPHCVNPQVYTQA